MATTEEKKYVVGIGEALLDVFPDGPKIGGAPLIFAYHASKSNCNGVIVSAIGKDVDGKGEKILQDIKKLELTTDYIYRVEDKPSGVVEVDNSDLDNPLYKIETNAAWTEIPYDEKLKELAKKTAAVYFGPLASFCGKKSKATIDSFLKAVPEDCLKVFDVNFRRNPDENGVYSKALYNKKLILEYIEKCNVLKVNNEELEVLSEILRFKGGDIEKCYSIMGEYPHISILIVTMGRYGSSVYWRPNGDEEIAHSSLGMPVNLKNTVGAGDALAGAFIGELLRGKSHVAAHHFAARRSAMVCEAVESMPKVAQHDLFISYSWKDEHVVADVFCKLFNDLGFRVWRDKNKTRCGDTFTEEIKKAIKNSEVVVFFSSRYSNISPYVEMEIRCAVENKKTIIPIKLDDSLYSNEIGSQISNIDYLDLNRFISSIEKQVYGYDRRGEGYVVGIGELLWDCFSTGRRMGGAPANFAYHASQFGYNTLVVSAVGEDRDGDGLVNELKDRKLASCIQRVGLPTGTVTVDTSAPNDPKYVINTDVAWSDISYTNKLAIIAKNCMAVCFGTLAQYGSQTQNTIGRFLEAVPKDCYKIYDVNLRRNQDKALYSDDVIIASIARCNVLKINSDELDYLTTLFSFDRKGSALQRSRKLLEKYPNIKILIVTMGTDGSLVFKGRDYSYIETPKVKVVDTVGAGDSFTGAFIGSILDGKTFKEAHRIAVNVSAYVCTQLGAMPVVPAIVRE